MHGHFKLRGLPVVHELITAFSERRGRKSDIPQDSMAWTKSVPMHLRSPLRPFTYTRGSTIAPRYLHCDWSFYCKLASNWSVEMVHV